MAQLSNDGASLVVTLTPLEKFLALRGEVVVPLSAVRRIEVLDDLIHQVHGLRPSRLKLFGSYIPGRVAVGTFLPGRERPAFVAVRRSPSRGLRITCDGTTYSQLLVGLNDPEAAKRCIEEVWA